MSEFKLNKALSSNNLGS